MTRESSHAIRRAAHDRLGLLSRLFPLCQRRVQNHVQQRERGGTGFWDSELMCIPRGPERGREMAKRCRFTAEFKARVALEALRGDRTIQQIAATREGLRCCPQSTG